MTEDDKDMVEAAAKGMVSGAVEPLKEQFTNLLSPITKEIGLMWGLQGRYWRAKRAILIAEKMNKLFIDRGITAPQQVPPKLLVPVMEYGSLEDDDAMSERWANLLASAADPNYKQPILPSFADILRQLSPKETAILDKLYGVFVVGSSDKEDLVNTLIPVAENFDEYDRDQFAIAFDNLKRLDLLKSFGEVDSPALYPKNLCLTRLGFAFVSACRSPGKPGQLKIQKYIEAEKKWSTLVLQ